MAEPVTGWGPDDAGLPSEDALAEAAYLVSRGVRPMALAGHCDPHPMVMLRARTRLSTASMLHGTAQRVIPFVIEEKDSASCGYAARSWVIDLFRWACLPEIPPRRRHEILGLLLGYSAEAIGAHQELGAGELFTMPITAPEPEREAGRTGDER